MRDHEIYNLKRPGIAVMERLFEGMPNMTQHMGKVINIWKSERNHRNDNWHDTNSALAKLNVVKPSSQILASLRRENKYIFQFILITSV